MVLPKNKMVLATFLAITLALLLTGAIYYLPIYPQAPEQPLPSPSTTQATPIPTQVSTPSPNIPQTPEQSILNPVSTPNPSTASIPTPAPIPSPVTPAPTIALPSALPTLTPAPASTAVPTTLPTPSPAVPMPASSSGALTNTLPILFVVAAIIVAIVTVYVLFSERELKNEN